jgi:hypothetical protein
LSKRRGFATGSPSKDVYSLPKITNRQGEINSSERGLEGGARPGAGEVVEAVVIGRPSDGVAGGEALSVRVLGDDAAKVPSIGGRNGGLEAVDRGVPLYCVVEFELSRPRWYWFDEKPMVV